jgi:ornithine cyclodeaminase/alanine dehydrogenase-like protein (mu-crystallin family)
MIEVRNIKKVIILNRTIENAIKLKKLCENKFKNVKFTISEEPNEAIKEADIICCTTNSNKPLFNGKLLKDGVHINCIGSYLPTMQEVDCTTIIKSKVVADKIEDCLSEAGDLIIPIAKKLIDKSHILCDLSQLITMKKSLRETDNDITLFKSVGVALQDIGIGHVVFKNAQKLKLGKEVNYL